MHWLGRSLFAGRGSPELGKRTHSETNSLHQTSRCMGVQTFEKVAAQVVKLLRPDRGANVNDQCAVHDPNRTSVGDNPGRHRPGPPRKNPCFLELLGGWIDAFQKLGNRLEHTLLAPSTHRRNKLDRATRGRSGHKVAG